MQINVNMLTFLKKKCNKLQLFFLSEKSFQYTETTCTSQWVKQYDS